ncbi:Uncharacterised protein [uncultured archaeon]|nr:Uncharacterised protein [uncultured archaeon]
MADPQKKVLEAPRVDGFKVFAKLNGTLKDVEANLRTISFVEVLREKDQVSATYVESRDIEKNPYTFALFKFGAESIEVLYSIPPNVAPKKRKLDMVRYFLNMLTAMGKAYAVEPTAIYQLLDASLKELNDFVSMDYNRLYTNYDNLKKDYEDVSRRYTRLQKESEGLKQQNYELKTKSDELAVRLKQLETMSDETIKEKLQDWLSEHGGEVNVGEFSKVYKIPESKVEEMLNALVKEGYIQGLQ